MQQIVYAMRFRGEGVPAGTGVFHVTSSAPGSRITSTVGPSGLTGKIETIADGPAATFTSTVEMTSETTFTESGTITFGEGNSLTFSTRSEGFMDASPQEGLSHGTIVWRVDGGTGQFTGATGLITSNFTFADSGEATDHQFGVIWID